MEEKDNCEDIILIASALATQLSKGKTIREIIKIRSIVNQISCTLSTIITEKIENKKTF
ncbi:MAG: hypothetical protein IJ008_01925 [Clostridia bacterium]|nr:hypothetical protein [Clostridia bacterium]